ncbi:SusC/RagA family TonB-linked outer membrane protein [Runella sp. CRIBMP]|uniref:SusC/RagA family TonB-linked outer membrane protein n=1 Tax=Runella sp. CRIBMP TaxID=2683261 RepID=UPI001411CC06|nr:TonB-dependent receptor [Runella sp. CRIBMP]NBB22513.1 SusC/RagA family TonB-linked outer membrane protein [Runella sp. CRIBMP]
MNPKLLFPKLLFGTLIVLQSMQTFAQNITVRGKVTGDDGAGMPGVSVLLKGTTIGTNTDEKGTFSISNVSAKGTLVFSSIGFITKEAPIGNRSTINVSLTEDTKALSEVVVVGYGTVKKSDLTGAVASIKATQLENENPRTIQDMLRGNAAGLDVSLNTSAKGGGDFLVRGRASLNASTAPLIVVDGVIYPGQLSDINPNDIATVDILKDASSAAVFGARSANGVILLTTKKGKSGKPLVTFNVNFGKNNIGKSLPLLSPQEFLDWRNDVLWSMNGHDPARQYMFTDPRKLPSTISVPQWMALGNSQGDPVDVWLSRLRMTAVEIKNYKEGRTLDWEKELYNFNSLQQDHTASVSGSTDNTNYYVSLGYLTNQGLTKGDYFSTIRGRVNIETKVTKFLTMGTNLQFADRDESSIPINLNNMIQTTPYGQLYQDDGVTLRQSTNDDVGNNTNPYLDQYYNTRLRKFTNMFGSIYVKGDIGYGFSYQINYTPRFEFYTGFDHVSSQKPGVTTRNGITSRVNEKTYQWQIDNILKWNKSFGQHNFDVTFLANAEKYQIWNTTVNAENYSPSDNLTYHNLAAATLYPSISSNDQYQTGDALMGRINYNFNQRYYLTVTARRDGFSAFGQGNPRATFPSVALGWVLTEENFAKGLSRWLDYGKIRLSYGENGNREIGRYAALSALTSSVYSYTNPGGTTFNVGAVRTANMSNPNLRWERNSSINVGIDFGFLNSKITGSLDYYDRKTVDLLMNRSLPNITGFASVVANLGQVSNNGMELTLNTENLKKTNFVWRSNFAFWTNQNKILKLYGPVPVTDAAGNTTMVDQDDRANGWFIGKPVNQIWDYKVLGVWQESERDLAKSYGFTPGDFKLEDLNGDGKYTIDDRQFLGHQNPKFSFNFRNEFRLYKNFDFSFAIYGRIGQNTEFNEAKNVDRFYDRSQFYKRPYWTPENPINDYAKMMSAAGGSVAYNVWRKSSFVRLNNISIAYSLPQSMLSKIKFQSLKIYLNQQNAAVFTPWEYFDPENKGLTPSTTTVGLNVTF